MLLCMFTRGGTGRGSQFICTAAAGEYIGLQWYSMFVNVFVGRTEAVVQGCSQAALCQELSAVYAGLLCVLPCFDYA